MNVRKKEVQNTLGMHMHIHGSASIYTIYKTDSRRTSIITVYQPAAVFLGKPPIGEYQLPIGGARIYHNACLDTSYGSIRSTSMRVTLAGRGSMAACRSLAASEEFPSSNAGDGLLDCCGLSYRGMKQREMVRMSV